MILRLTLLNSYDKIINVKERSIKMKLIKEVIKKNDKKYINYVLVFEVNGKFRRVPIEPKTFGKSWDSRQVRTSYFLLDLISERTDKNN